MKDKYFYRDKTRKSIYFNNKFPNNNNNNFLPIVLNYALRNNILKVYQKIYEMIYYVCSKFKLNTIIDIFFFYKEIP